MLTRSGWLVAVGALGSIFAGRAFGLPELYVMGASGLVLVLVAVVSVGRPVPSIQVQRLVRPARVPLGGLSRVELQITNSGRRTGPVLALHDPVEGTVGARMAVAPLAPGDQQTAAYRLPTERRGLVHVGPLTAEVTDPFGLARRSIQLTGEQTLTVLPAIEMLRKVAAGGGLDDPMAGATRTVLGSAGGEEFASLRPYVVGDDLRRVHWASSARAGDLLVRQDDPPWQGHITVVLDARRDRGSASAFEGAVSAAASLVQAVAEKGDRVRLVITDGTDTGLVDARASRDMLLEHLALVQRHEGGELPRPPLDGRRRTGELVVVSGGLRPEEVQPLQAARDRFARVRLVVVRPWRPTADTAEIPIPASTPGVEVLTVGLGVSFAASWHASVAREPRP